MPPAAPAAPAAAGGAANNGQQRPQSPSLISTILRMAIMWYVMSMFKGKKPMSKNPEDNSAPKFSKGTFVDMYCFISEQPSVRRYNMAELVWSETGVALGLQDARNYSYTYEPSMAVQNNGSVYLHVVIAKEGMPIDPRDPRYDVNAVFGRVNNLIRYMPKPKNSTGVNLLSDIPMEPVQKEEGPREIISFIKPNVTIQIVDHFETYPKNAIPPQFRPFMQFDDDLQHYPILHFNDFWLLRDKYVAVNTTLTNVTIHFDLGTISAWWWQLMMQMDKSFEMQVNMGLQQDGEGDDLKRVLLEGNPVLLSITFVVSMLHTVFDMLAFKNDIGFWKNNKSMEGLSARSVIINAGCQLVILLYLLDNETSWMVLFSSVLGTGIEFWKVTKAMHVSVQPTFPFIKLKDRASYAVKTKTKQYDDEAMRYLSYVLYPLVIGYSIYALIYNTHKSWYSWILNSLVGAVYMFGFILMCPQLYLNYKLKSVAHLPWRQMTYKFLNTIIDDLFAFVIKMPALHRLSVFRDDLIFCIYLYQRWAYRVDKSRVNEFGYTEAGPVTDEDDAQAQPAAAAGAIAAGEEQAGKRAQEEPQGEPSEQPAGTVDAPESSKQKRKNAKGGKQQGKDATDKSGSSASDAKKDK